MANLERVKEQQRANRSLLDAIKRGSGCADCGGKFPPEAMDFDHVRGQKVRDISKMLNCSMKRIYAELLKCDVVCANCHRIRTKARNDVGRKVCPA